MKLNIVPARTGLLWVKLGIQTFFRQPLAMGGLFFMFMAMISIVSIVPLIGSALALGLLPAATLGLMAATQEAHKGKFPMPSILISAFRAGRQRLRAMLLLGAFYAVGFLLIMGISTLIDGGKMARLYLMGGEVTREIAMAPDFQRAMWVTLALYMPFSLLFWHAPALVHWHGLPPVKSLFFSLVACFRNFWAYTVFGLAWVGVFMVGGLTLGLFAGLLAGPQAASVVMVPTVLLMASMFFTSIYFTFRDSFVAESDPPEGATP